MFMLWVFNVFNWLKLNPLLSSSLKQSLSNPTLATVALVLEVRLAQLARLSSQDGAGTKTVAVFYFIRAKVKEIDQAHAAVFYSVDNPVDWILLLSSVAWTWSTVSVLLFLPQFNAECSFYVLFWKNKAYQMWYWPTPLLVSAVIFTKLPQLTVLVPVPNNALKTKASWDTVSRGQHQMCVFVCGVFSLLCFKKCFAFQHWQRKS